MANGNIELVGIDEERSVPIGDDEYLVRFRLSASPEPGWIDIFFEIADERVVDAVIDEDNLVITCQPAGLAELKQRLDSTLRQANRSFTGLSHWDAANREAFQAAVKQLNFG
jgi:hypothetical protein